MADISRTATPISPYDEDLYKTREELEESKRTIRKKHETGASFIVGSIENINEKIANLDETLRSYADRSKLVIESRVADPDDDIQLVFEKPSKATMKKEQDVKELNQFAGIYTMKATLMPQAIPKLEKLQKSLSEPRDQKKAGKEKTSGSTPKLVELHQYPGFDNSALTPIPEIDSLAILKKITSAQKDLHKKPTYTLTFKKLLYSRMSEAVLVDTFWWFFLQRYQPSKQTQYKHFNRIAFNYFKLLTYTFSFQYGDVFLQSYPRLLAQGVYASFCQAFPTSWRQFGDDFKSSLADLTSEWVSGIKAIPRSWTSWNYQVLEPPDMKKGDVASSKKSKKGGGIFKLDFLVSESTHSLAGRSSRSASVHSTSSKSFTTASVRADRKKSTADSSGRSQTSAAIEAVSQAQGVKRPEVKVVEVSLGEGKRDVLTPIHEDTGGDHQPQMDELSVYTESVAASSILNPATLGAKNWQGRKPGAARAAAGAGGGKRASNRAQLAAQKKPGDPGEQPLVQPSLTSFGTHLPSSGRKIVESHPACKGPDYVKAVFNIHGKSPLVTHCLIQQKMKYQAGMNIHVNRTEIRNLPPVDTPSYREVIRDSYRTLRLSGNNYRQMYSDGAQAHVKFLKEQKVQLERHLRRENKLMSRENEVKRLSDLLVLELLKDANEMSTGAAAEIENSLMS